MGKTVTVALCGVQPRIGTTTQALQMVAYLQMMGYTAAYVELGDQEYIYQMRKLYRDITVKDGVVFYDRLPLYSDIKSLVFQHRHWKVHCQQLYFARRLTMVLH